MNEKKNAGPRKRKGDGLKGARSRHPKAPREWLRFFRKRKNTRREGKNRQPSKADNEDKKKSVSEGGGRQKGRGERQIQGGGGTQKRKENGLPENG